MTQIKAMRMSRSQPLHAFTSWISGLKLASFRPIFRTLRQPHITDHHARDIGLTVTQIELIRLKLPSQDPRSPML